MSGASLTSSIWQAWRDVRASMRTQMALPKEENRLLFYVFLGCALGFVAGLPAALSQARLIEEEGAVTGVLVGRLFASIFFAPLALYGVSAIATVITRAFGGKGSFYTGRLALFWAVLVSLPILLVSGALGAAPLSPNVLGWISFAAYAVFLWVWSQCIAEGFGLRSGLPVVISLGILPLFLAFILKSMG
ncbi:MAG: hypothetical protein AAFR93_13630 [Pseudomonadota bacterium]